MTNINNKKGAMFGLDARIALAIFGALSVISGAALYSAIQEAKIVAILTELKEVEKAVSQYMLDTGLNMPVSSIVGQESSELSAYALVSKPLNVNNWKGPYLQYAKDSSLDFLIKSSTEKIGVLYRKNGDWGGFSIAEMQCRRSYSSCHVWIGLSGISLDIMKALETKIDGTISPGITNSTGIFRYKGDWSHIRSDIPFPPELSHDA